MGQSLHVAALQPVQVKNSFFTLSLSLFSNQDSKVCVFLFFCVFGFSVNASVLVGLNWLLVHVSET